ncbi:Glycosyl transferase [Trichostrongylus colubriformis]|uniref:GDP-Man:Man(3)GlcNAc(2)-PP-Dol alpha-1,2-mannosyltransferase n=2 Tax=Strongyloidea TaxID=27829 RepID=A0AAN8FFH9_TRICO
MIWALFFLFMFLLIIRTRRKSDVVAFFHPYCNAGGGGERVLWCAIRTMQQQWPNLQFFIYSGDYDATKEQILLKAKQRFGITVDPKNVHFVFLRLRRIVEADLYPRFTLLLQTLAGFILGFEALLKLNPEVFIDSMGYPLTLPLFRWIAGSRIAAYVHYPTISHDMIDLVARRERTYNNDDIIVRYNILINAKLLYYRLFAFFYGLCGQAVDVVMVNGSWTGGHIRRLWFCDHAKVVFPPCDVTAFLALEQVAEAKFTEDKVLRILSIGQIRPEKNHKLQLEVLRTLVKKLAERSDGIKVVLTIAGGCRNQEDHRRVTTLKDMCAEWGLTSNVQWKLNVPYEELLDLLSESLISIHTMWNEHFGISVVEGMAAGTVMLAHDSGGPQMDIVLPIDGKNETQPIGFLAATKEAVVGVIDAQNHVYSDNVMSFIMIMKLYSILIYHKADDGTVRSFKSAFDLSSFSFFQRGSVQEFMQFTGKLLVERSGLGARSTVKENEYFCHCYVRSDGLAAVSVTDGEYQARIAMSMMTRVLDDFSSKVHAVQWAQIKTEKDCLYTGLPELLAKWQNPREADPMTRVQEEVEETKIVMHNTIQSVLERGEKLDDLVKKSENLSDQSKLFYTQARKMNKCCNYY